MAARRKIEKHHCPQCDTDKERGEYGNDKTRKDGRYRICKACDAVNQRAWRAKRKEELDAAKAIKEEQDRKEQAAAIKASVKRPARRRVTKAAA